MNTRFTDGMHCISILKDVQIQYFAEEYCSKVRFFRETIHCKVARFPQSSCVLWTAVLLLKWNWTWGWESCFLIGQSKLTKFINLKIPRNFSQSDLTKGTLLSVQFWDPNRLWKFKIREKWISNVSSLKSRKNCCFQSKGRSQGTLTILGLWRSVTMYACV